MNMDFAVTAASLAEEPLLQGLLVAFATFILEDPTTIACGFLVVDGKMAYWTAYISLSLGIALGDMGLYALGRFFAPWVRSTRLVPKASFERAEAWFGRNLVLAVVLSRFVPGMRLPTYTAAGLLRAHPLAFLGVALGASLVWTWLLLWGVMKLGGELLPRLGPLKWGIAASVVVVIAVVQWALGRRVQAEQPAEPRREAPIASFFEFWPPWLFYIPVVLHYLVLAVRYRSLTLPTASNPRIYSGGLVRESKGQILSLANDRARRWIAPWVVWRRPPADVTAEDALSSAEAALSAYGLTLPIVAKPDMGQRGAGVRPIRTRAELAAYIAEFPHDTDIILQQLVEWGNEAGVLFTRMPGEDAGRIVSITLKEFPFVTGDGTSTLRELILADPRAQLIQDVYLARHHARLQNVLPAGENFPLVFAGNHCQGTIFLDGTHLATEELRARMQEIAENTEELYFARFDLRFRNMESFLRGEEFLIVEINGAGAESTHIWDARMTLGRAYAALFEQWRTLFAIGDRNRARGARPIGALAILRDFALYLRTSKNYPSTL